MADSLMINVPKNFNLNTMVMQLSDMYRAQGFTVNVAFINPYTAIVEFDKGVGGINTLLGLDIGIKANISLNNGTLMVNYTEASWTGKIVGLCVGWLICLIPFITAIIGCINQSKFPREVNSKISMLAAGGGAPQGSYNPNAPYSQGYNPNAGYNPNQGPVYPQQPPQQNNGYENNNN